jgi:hypothetical protein
MISVDKLQKDYDRFKARGIQLAGKYPNRALRIFRYCAQLASSFPSLGFGDSELEESIRSIAANQVAINEPAEIVPGRVVIYDSHFRSDGGVLFQYLNYFINQGFQIKIVTTAKGGKIEFKNDQVSVERIDVQSEIAAVERVHSSIVDFCPQYIFIHLKPSDVIGFGALSNIQGVSRYFINLTDHIFWLGRLSADYFLEFRSFGMNLSMKQRGIPRESLLYLPYYPKIERNEFQGFGFAKEEGDVVALIGGNFYKLLLDPDLRYLKMIGEVGKQHKSLKVIVVGWGKTKFLQQFLKEHELQNQFILLDKREDISELINNVDIYINTYPLIGGLMSMHAALHNKPILTYAPEKFFSNNSIGDLLNNDNLPECTSEVEFKEHLTQLVLNKEERLRYSNYSKAVNVTEAQFKERLDGILLNKYEAYQLKELVFDFKAYGDLYIKMENLINREARLTKLRLLKFEYFRVQPFRFLLAVVQFVISKFARRKRD